jgi:hypothetical protein
MNPKFTTPLIPMSWGETIDKITILEIKQEYIKSAMALSNITKELNYLNDIFLQHEGVALAVHNQKKELLDINKRLWKVEDDIRDKELKQEFDAVFIDLARQVYRLNDERAKIKKIINITLQSELVEEKSYKDFQAN